METDGALRRSEEHDLADERYEIRKLGCKRLRLIL